MVLEDLYRLLKAGHVQAHGVVDTMSQAVVVLDRESMRDHREQCIHQDLQGRPG